MISSHLVYKYIITLLAVCLSLSWVQAQQSSEEKVNIEKENKHSFLYSDSLFIGDSIRFPVDSDSYENTLEFYDSLRNKANSNYLAGLLYDIFMVDAGGDDSLSGKSQVDQIVNPYESFKGKVIRNIRVRQLDVFNEASRDTSFDATTWYEDIGSWIHVPTHRSIIRENILFKAGDRLDPNLLKDNGRILRNLQYIKDARFLVQPVEGATDSVDVIVFTQDLWSKGFDVNLGSISSGEVQLFDNNFFGMGHKFQANLIFDYFKTSNPGIETAYKLNNIRGTFIDGRFYFMNAFETNRFGFEVSRDFYSYKTKMVGGMKVFRTKTKKNIIQQDTTFSQARLNYINHDFWYGYAFGLNTGNGFFGNRNRLVLSARYRDDRFFDHPEITERYNYRFHDNQLILGNISYSRENFYKSALIYGFGRTEDIPVGDLIGYTFGWEHDQFFRRFYSGITLKHGEFLRNFGYLSAGLEAGGFLYDDRLEQAALHLETQYISKLFDINDLKVRQFFNVEYTHGYRRFPEESLSFNRIDDIRGFRNGNLYGNEKLVLKSETVGFTNLYYYGFRLALYGFLDIGFLGSEKKFILSHPMKSGFGLGVRLRNENFVFNTFQIRLGFYPTLASEEQFLFNLSGEKNLSPTRYTPQPPHVVEF